MKYCVLGAGLMGKAVAHDLLDQKDTTQVILCDKDVKAIHELPLQNQSRLQTKILDVTNYNDVVNIFKNVDVAVAAIHYGFNLVLTKAAIETKTNLCDLGGNSSVVDEQLKLNDAAKNAGISVIPDCGLAPGMVAVLVKWGIEKFSWANTVKIRVGGLPQNPKGKLKYERFFSTEGLINEYVEPVRVLRDGQIKIIEPLSEIEEIKFDNFPRLEAFTTSGGTSTLIDTYKNRLKNLDYKTIRYEGHCKLIREMYDEGLFSEKSRKNTLALLEKTIPLGKKDVVLVKIIFQGRDKVTSPTNKHELSIIDSAKPPFTAMMRTTAFPASIIAQMLARGQIKEIGVQPQERCVPVDLFVKELKKREIIISGI